MQVVKKGARGLRDRGVWRFPFKMASLQFTHLHTDPGLALGHNGEAEPNHVDPLSQHQISKVRGLGLETFRWSENSNFLSRVFIFFAWF